MPRYEDPALTLKLIKEVEKYPCLYNCKLDSYSRRDLNDEAWEKVAKTMNDTAYNCKIKWRNLRTVFVRKLKHAGKSPRKPYYLTESMRFIMPFIKGTASLDNTTTDYQPASPHESETDDDSNMQVLQEEHEIEEPDDHLMHTGYPLIEPINTVPIEKIKIKRKAKIDAESKKNIDEARKYFLLSLLPDVQKLTENHMRTFRRKVIDTLDEFLEKYVGDSVSGRSSPVGNDSYLQPNHYITENSIHLERSDPIAENPLKLEY